MVVKCQHGFQAFNRRLESSFFKICYCAYFAFTVKRFPTVNNNEALLSPKLYLGKLLALEIFNMTNQMDLFTDTAAILSCIVSYSYYWMLRMQSSIYLPPKNHIIDHNSYLKQCNSKWPPYR